MNSNLKKPISAPAWIVSPANKQDKRTFCVLGTARGGTSMVAGLLMQLGIPMGDTIDPFNNEDSDFLIHNGMRDIFENPKKSNEKKKFVNQISSTITARNSKYSVWGWKDPISINYIPDIYTQLVNPHFIWIMRDPAAVAMREMLEEAVVKSGRLYAFTGQALKEASQVQAFLSHKQRPTLLISYERALRHPAELLATLCTFVGKDFASLTPSLKHQLVDYIQPDRRTGDINAARSTGNEVPVTSSEYIVSPLLSNFSEYQEDLERAYAEVAPGTRGYPAKPKVADSTTQNAWHSELYEFAATAANASNFKTAYTACLALIREFAITQPLLALGPAVLGRAISRSKKLATDTPETIVGLYNIIGLAKLNAGKPGDAFDYFNTGFMLARKRVQLTPPSLHSLCASLTWWLAFHAIVSARQASLDIEAEQLTLLLSHYAKGRGGDANAASAAAMFDRL